MGSDLVVRCTEITAPPKAILAVAKGAAFFWSRSEGRRRFSRIPAIPSPLLWIPRRGNPCLPIALAIDQGNLSQTIAKRDHFETCLAMLFAKQWQRSTVAPYLRVLQSQRVGGPSEVVWSSLIGPRRIPSGGIESTAISASSGGWENAPQAFSSVSRLENLGSRRTMELVVLFVPLLGPSWCRDSMTKQEEGFSGSGRSLEYDAGC